MRSDDRNLEGIYRDLAAARISKQEALDRVLELKRRQPDGNRLLLAAPTWQAAPVENGAAAEAGERYVLLCELPVTPTELRALLPCDGCEALPSVSGGSIARRYAAHAAACLEWLKAILQREVREPVLVQWCLPATDDMAALAGMASMLKVAMAEYPRFRGQCVLVQPGSTAAAVARQLEEAGSCATETVLRYERDTRPMSLRWRKQPMRMPGLAWKERGVYLITGQLSRRGLLFADAILTQTRHAQVVLASFPEPPRLSGELQALQAQAGDRLHHRSTDLRDPRAAAQLVTSVVRQLGSIEGILHDAAALAPAGLLSQSAAQFEQSLAWGIMPAANLDEVSRELRLDFFALFCSAASILGEPGKVGVTAQDGFLDALAQHRQRLAAEGKCHGRSVAMHWPAWQAIETELDREALAMLEHATGMRLMSTARGMRAFHASIMAGASGSVLVAEGNPDRLKALHGRGDRAPLPSTPRANAPASEHPDEERHDLQAKVRKFLCREFSALLKVPVERLDAQESLQRYGIDSILAMRLTGHLEKTFGPLSKTLLFEHRSLADLADHLVDARADVVGTLFRSLPKTPAVAPDKGSVGRAGASSTSTGNRRDTQARPAGAAAEMAPPPANIREPGSDPIAIVGLSGRYPEAWDVEAYWANLREGRDCIVEVPRQRWDWREYYSEDRTEPGRHYSRWGGFIEGVDEFDPQFFNISPREATRIDPQERLFLQHAWMALEDAGCTRADLHAQARPAGASASLSGQVGVYAGVMYSEYQLFGVEASARGQRTGLVGSTASIANRVSYAFDLHGPSMTVDTMCSSSLTAIHLACQDLRLGRVRLAIAGGVNVSIHPNKYLAVSAGQFISSDGRCQSFGEGGDGYIPGEGVGVVILKRLSDAERDGDRIYGLIRGSALNHGGRTNGYTVPNPQAQAGVIEDALADAGVDARWVSYLEAHGTGTRLGDPIEIAALSKAFGRTTGDRQFCLIGSAKSNIGHCEAAAGMAGLTKVLLQMRYRQIVPSLHSSKLNPHIDFESTPFRVNQVLTEWEAPVLEGRHIPRIAGLSSFGAGGSNAHMVIQEYVQTVRPASAPGAVAIVLSARTGDQLRQKARDLLQFLATADAVHDLAAIAYTLQTGREAMNERLGFVVHDVKALAECLEAFAQDRQDAAIHVGQAQTGMDTLAQLNDEADIQQTLERWLTAGKLDKVLSLWVKGLSVPWKALYPDAVPGRIGLPGYPFARERYWIDVGTGPQDTPAMDWLHPLLQTNTSSLYEQSYRSSFSGGEAFCCTQRSLDGTVYLEMLRAAAADALRHGGAMELKGVQWHRPVPIVPDEPVVVLVHATGDSDLDCEVFSERDGGRTDHVRGRASELAGGQAERLDLGALRQRYVQVAQHTYRSDNGLLVRLDPVWPEQHDSPAYLLHPRALLALKRAVDEWLTGTQSTPASHQPVALDRLRVYAACREAAWAWIRPAATDPADLDIDLCDDSGLVQAELRGWTLAATEQNGSAHIVWTDTCGVRLEDEGKGVIALHVEAGDNTLTRSVCVAMCGALEAARSLPTLRVLVLQGTGTHFLQGGQAAQDAVLETGLHRAFADFPYPIIAAVAGDALGVGLWLGTLCDVMVCAADVRHGYTAAHAGGATRHAPWLYARLGARLVRSLCFPAAELTGDQMREAGWTGMVVPRAEVNRQALSLAGQFAAKPAEALQLLRAHLADPLHIEPQALSPADGKWTNLADATVMRCDNLDAQSIERELGGLLTEMAASGTYHAVILAGANPSLAASRAGDVLALQHLIMQAPVPVISALGGEASGASWLLALCCDAMVLDEEGRYGIGHADLDPQLMPALAWLAAEHLGQARAREAFLTGDLHAGASLGSHSGFATVASAGQMLDKARTLADTFANQAYDTLAGWKRSRLDAFTSAQGQKPGRSTEPEQPAPAEGRIPLASQVVSATARAGGVLVIQMCDRDARNMFSQALVAGLEEAFAHAAAEPYKVVVLTGYDHFFASGGTKESLLAIQSGAMRFTDYAVFHIAMRCPVPVIAAMQGHGIGAGWALGLFGDIALHAEEGRYSSPYMNYGFTPGAGATLALPARLGWDLARESLFAGHEYSGRELRERGALMHVLPREHVLDAALQMAASMTRQSRQWLVASKALWSAALRASLEDVLQRELTMHERTFVGRDDTLSLIERRFQPAVAPVPSTGTAIPAAPLSGHDASEDVMATLRRLLAHELQLPMAALDENAQFVDLGLDSVVGVTWVRKINEAYGLDIEATRVYGHPTLARMSRHVAEELQRRGRPRPSASTPVAAVPAPMPASVPEPMPAPATVAAAEAGPPPADVSATLRRLLAHELQLPEEHLDERSQLVDLGLDSVVGVTWVRKINEAYGLDIEATRVYSHPTLAQMSRHVGEQLQRLGRLPVPAAPPPASGPVATTAIASPRPAGSPVPVRRKSPKLLPAAAAPSRPQSIAVVGMAGRFPAASDLHEYWRNLAEGRDCITPVSPERWDTDRYYQPGDVVPGRTNSRWLGALDGYDLFDPLFFCISPREAEHMDPQQRLFLQTCWHAFEDAGFSPRGLSGSRCGVFVGCAHGDYQQLSAQQRLTAQGFTGNASSMLAARISYLLDLQGPCLSIDTACSSSLVAIAHACDSLVNGTSDLALAGGVYVMVGPDMHIKTAQAGMLSVDGRCFTFDQRANGFVPGEAVGAVVLKRLADALRDNDPIYGVVEGWGVNQDGRTNGITAPNPHSQARLQQEVYSRFGIDPGDIQMIEAHGTGTKLGDPIEVDALKASFGKYTQQEGYCALGSVKSNIGHCLTAAGAAGFIKLMLSLQHRQQPPTIHFERLNEHIRLKGSPFYVNTSLRPWVVPEGKSRRAAMSSFGFGGTNAHVVVAEAPAQATHEPSTGPELIVLSARSAERLREKVRDMLAYLAREPEASLASIAYTLQVGREAMEDRLGFVAATLADMSARLQAFLDGDAVGIYQGQVRQGKGTSALFTNDADLQQLVERWLDHRRLEKLAELWVKGLEWDWGRLHRGRIPHRVRLPGYPFARERYWHEGSDAATVERKAEVIHPLLHANTSDLYHHSYRSVFRGDEPFFSDARALHPAAHMEMALAALVHAGRLAKGEAVLLRDVRWSAPVPIESDTPVTVALDVAGDSIGFTIASAAEEGEDNLHCDGDSSIVPAGTMPRLDVEALRGRMRQAEAGVAWIGNAEILANLPEPAAKDAARTSLIPMLDAAWRVGGRLLGLSGRISAVESIAFDPFAPVASQVWIRCGTHAWDLDLCDASGVPQWQLRGVAVSDSGQAPQPGPVFPAAETAGELPSRAPRQALVIQVGHGLVEPDSATTAPDGPGGKPRIVLPPPRSIDSAALRPQVHRPRITLADTGSGRLAAGTVRVVDHGDGVVEVRMDTADGNPLSAELAQALRRALDTARAIDSLRVLVLLGTREGFLQGRQYAHLHESGIAGALADFPYPVVAAMAGHATDAGWWLGSFCDMTVCAAEASYGFTAFGDPWPASHAGTLRERFGDLMSERLLSPHGAASGKDWKTWGWSAPVVAGEDVEQHAFAWADRLKNKPAEASQLLKAHLGRAWRKSLAVEDAVLAHGATAWTSVDEPIEIHCDARSIETVSRQLAGIVEEAKSSGRCRAIILGSQVAPFDGDVQPDALANFQRLIAEAPVPVVAAWSGDALGAGWSVALCCDAAVYSETGWYGAADLHDIPALTATAARLAPICFGDVLGREMLLTGESFTGAALKLRQPTLQVAPAEQVHSLAREWAKAWLADGGVRLASRKRERLKAWQAPGTDDPAWPGQPVDLPAPSVGRVELRSEVIVATAHPGGVLLVQLHDREARNMYSPALVDGMKEAFGHVAEHAYKVVVLSGFDSYFASGGTRESLLAIQSGAARFTDQSIFLLPIQCPLPVIAAMQGHGIGAGWSLGLFADVGIYAEESHYVSPYMGYGFTPGAGATLMAPVRLGVDLARESLLSAHEYSGAELRERGLAHAVLPRDQVVSAALALAARIASQPREHLLRLKRTWNASLLASLDSALQEEVAMHERTFVGQQETTTRIQARFAELDASAPRDLQPSPQRARTGAAQTPTSIKAKLKEALDAELHLQGRPIDDDDGFTELGMDSIIGVTWIRRVNEMFGTSYEATTIYSYPTIREFAAFLQANLPAAPEPVLPGEMPTAQEPREQPAPVPPVPRRRPSTARRFRPPSEDDRIAIVGMSARYPQAPDLDAFWANLVQGRDSIVEVPSWRWDVARFYDPQGLRANTAVSKWLGAMEDIDCFDTLFFRISPEEASLMDPQHRLFLEESYRAFEDAGYAHRELSDKRCGVYLGISTNDYAVMLARHGVMAPPVTGNSYSIAAARIAYHLNLKGPAISVDTACSSSLVALHLACQALRSGEIDMALAGGVSLWLTPEQYLSMNEAGMLSPTGQCRAFDAGANGIVMGDGVGAVVLKRLSDAVADGDAIHGVVACSGINQDGRTNGITAPSAVSQAELERSVFAKCGIDPATIGYVETHGTGTRLGDPIELEALTTVFREKTSKVGYCALASLKSNIGHTAAAAGIASLHKVLLSLRHRTIAPTLHVEKENPHFAFAESPFYVNRQARPWSSQEGAPLRACINSFGYSGTNAHAIIEEYVPSLGQVARGRHRGGDRRHVLPLSARTSEALRRKVSDLLAYLRSDRAAPLEEIARTLQLGREPMSERLGVLAGSVAEFADALQCWLEGGLDPGRFRQAQVGRATHEDEDDQAVRQYLESGDVDSLLAAWTRGVDVPWERLYADGMPGRAHLPTYPFARERYWIEGEACQPGPQGDAQHEQLGWIEDILERLEADELDQAQAISLLRTVE